MTIKETNLKFKAVLTKRNTTRQIILHHSASSGGNAELFHKVHLNNGWSGIGYHFVILKDGTIERGRPIDTMGAHSQGSNYNSIGICCVGNFQGNEKPSEAQYHSVIELCKTLIDMYPSINNIIGHREVCATICPGNLDVKMVSNYVFNRQTYKKDVTQVTTVEIAKYTISYGSKGENVKILQRNLNECMSSKLVVDGICGSKTRQAIMDFQRKYMGIDEVDGIYGVKTYTKMKEVVHL